MKKKVLVVEDQESPGVLYQDELKAEGYEVLTATNGKEAIEQHDGNDESNVRNDGKNVRHDERHASGKYEANV